MSVGGAGGSERAGAARWSLPHALPPQAIGPATSPILGQRSRRRCLALQPPRAGARHKERDMIAMLTVVVEPSRCHRTCFGDLDDCLLFEDDQPVSMGTNESLVEAKGFLTRGRTQDPRRWRRAISQPRDPTWVGGRLVLQAVMRTLRIAFLLDTL